MTLIQRIAPLLDIEIARDGDGRTVTAYAAAFNTPYEIHDHDGHYDEIINAKAFNRTISQGAVRRAQAVFNHGLTLYGTPSERYAMPLGTPVEIKADSQGLLTVTRFSRTDLADEVLELIRDGAIRGMSFRGETFRTAKPRPGQNGRPILERMELGLKDYGPTPFPANHDAAILAVRSLADLLTPEAVAMLTPDERAGYLALLSEGTPVGDPPADDDTPTEDPPAAEQTPDPAASIDLLQLAQMQRRRRS